MQRYRLHGFGRIAAAHEDSAATRQNIDHPQIAAVRGRPDIVEDPRTICDSVAKSKTIRLDTPQDNVVARRYRLLIAGGPGCQDEARKDAAVLFKFRDRRFAVALNPALIDPNDTA